MPFSSGSEHRRRTGAVRPAERNRYARGSRAQGSLTQQVALSGGAAAVFALIVSAALTMAIGMIASNYNLVYLSAAFMASAIPLLAAISRGRGFDLFEPITLVAAAIFFGTSLRAVWLLTSDEARVDFLMMGTTMEEVSRNTPAMLMSVIALTVGYALVHPRVPLERLEWFRDYRFGKKELWFAITLFSLLSILGIVLFMREHSISFTNGLLSQSMKRVASFAKEEGGEVYGVGYQRYLGMLSHHAFTLICGLTIAGILKFKPHVLLVTVAVGLISIAIPFLASSRSSLLLIALNVLILAYYYGKLKLSRLLLLFVISIPMLAWLGELRSHNQAQTPQQQEMSIAARVVGSGNSLDFVRTSAIMDRVPAVTDFQYGRSYLALIAGPIPRNIWPDKPYVSLGGFVKGTIFGQSVRLGGWPSGMIAEGWLNFGYIGMILPLFLFGAMLRIFYESFRPLLGVSFPATALYSVTVWRLGFGTIGLNFAHGIMQALFYLGPMIVLLVIAKRRGPRLVMRSVVQPR